MSRNVEDSIGYIIHDFGFFVNPLFQIQPDFISLSTLNSAVISAVIKNNHRPKTAILRHCYFLTSGWGMAVKGLFYGELGDLSC